MSAPKLRITCGKGFAFRANGYHLSVQIGTGNYCENRTYKPEDWHKEFDTPASQYLTNECTDCEIAIWPDGGEMLPWPHGDSVIGWVPVELLPGIMQAVITAPDETALKDRVWALIENYA